MPENPTLNRSFERVFNPRLQTDFAKERLLSLQTGINTKLPELKECIKATNLAAFFFGSVGIGTASNKATYDQREILRPSDTDICIVYDGQNQPHPLRGNVYQDISLAPENVTIETFLKSKFQDNEQVDVASTPLRTIPIMIDTLAINISALNREDHFLLVFLTSTLVCPTAGDRDFIKLVRKTVISHLQKKAEIGEKVWGKMAEVFQTDFVHYGNLQDQKRPQTDKKTLRARRAAEQILGKRGIPFVKTEHAIKLLAAQRKNISFPPLSQAEAIFLH